MKQGISYFGGTSNIALPVSNKAAFPEAFRAQSRLVYYASLFNSLEVNSTFKKLPMPRTIERWRSEVPSTFRFTYKMPAAVTHARELIYDPALIQKFMEVIGSSGENSGAVLVQFPSTVTIEHTASVKKILKSVQKANRDQRWQLAAELRHASWYTTPGYRLLQESGSTMVIHDLKGFQHPGEAYVHPTCTYLRLHGPEKGYRGSYSDASLRAYADQIDQWLNQGRDVYVYFNNTLGAAATNLLTLNEILRTKNSINARVGNSTSHSNPRH